jgi:hypothetical protein
MKGKLKGLWDTVKDKAASMDILKANFDDKK